MTPTIEVVRFDVQPERAGVLVSGHDAARLAIDALSPGWIWSRLARFDERSWVEIVAWNGRAAFDRALELSANDPVASAWFELADPGWTIVLGEPVADSVPIPPPAGSLELIEAGAGEDSALVATPDDGSAWTMLVEVEGAVWQHDGWRRSSPGMLRVTVPAPERGPAAPSWTEAATIAHSFDAEASSVGSG